VRLIVETGAGSIAHSELVYGDGLVMVGGTDEHWKKPAQPGWQHAVVERVRR
jgi:hypothetical protein